MRNLAVFASLGMLVVGVAVSCAGDEKVKHLSDGGGAGVGDGGVDAVGKGGGSSNPEGGAGGTAATGGAGAAKSEGGLGGVPPGDGNGGAGAPSLNGGGAGGAGSPIECEREVDMNYPCAQVEANWAPVWNPVPGRFELDVSSLPFPIESGTLSYFVNNADFQECGTVAVQVSGSKVYAPITIANIKLVPTNVALSTFSLVDVCGNHRDYDPRGVPNCSDLRGSGNFENWALTCNTKPAATCPEVCLGE